MKLVIRRFWKLLGIKIVALYLVAILAGAMLGVVELALAYTLQVFLTKIGVHSTQHHESNWSQYFSDPVNASVILVVIAVIRSLALFVSTQNSSYCGETVFSRFRALMAHKLLVQDGGKYIPASEVNLYFGEVFGRSAFVFNSMAAVVPLIIQIVILQIVMFKYSWQSSIVSNLGLLLIALPILILNKLILKHSIRTPDLQLTVNKTIERISRNWMLVKTMKTGTKEFAKIVSLNYEYCSVLVKNNSYVQVISILPSFLGILLVVVVISFDASFVHTPPSVLIAFLYLFIRFVQQLSSVNAHVSQIFSFFHYLRMSTKFVSEFSLNEIYLARSYAGDLGMMGRGNTFPLIPVKEVDVNYSKFTSSAELTTRRPPRIEVRGMTFGYSSNGPDILKDMSLFVESGSQLAIIGPSGVGKSTFLSLLLGILKPSEGSIRIDEMEPEIYFKQHSDVGYVGADPYVVEGTVLENIMYGSHTRYSEAEILDAINMAEAKFLLSPEVGLQYKISESGDGLSAGQKQRLSLVRALARKPSILILDEATANLDENTEEKIAKTIASLKGVMTTVIVSHRVGIIQFADQVVRFSGASSFNS